MTTLAITDLKARTAALSRPLRDGEEVTLTFHANPLGQAVPIEQLRREREELALLRKVIADPRLRQLAIDLGLVSEIELHVA